MDVIAVTGTPGTGKTYLSKRLSSHLGFEYIDLNSLARDSGWVDGYDEGRACDIIDEGKLRDGIAPFLEEKAQSGKKGLVLDSHMAHLIPKGLVSLCIVVRCPLPLLKGRLEARGYTASKVRENLDSEIFDVCLVEAAEEGHDVLEMSSSDDPSRVSKTLE